MGLYNKIENAFGKKAANTTVSIFLVFKCFPLEIKRLFKIVLNNTIKSFINPPRIFLLPTPDYGNLGDQLIALAEICWLQDFFPNNETLVFGQDFLTKDKSLRLFLSQVKKNDLIFFQGGGNLNNLYLISENIRRLVLKKCSKKTLTKNCCFDMIDLTIAKR